MTKGRGLPGRRRLASRRGPRRTPGPSSARQGQDHPTLRAGVVPQPFGRSAIKDLPEQATLLADPMAWCQDPVMQLSTAVGLVLAAPSASASAAKLRDHLRQAEPGDDERAGRQGRRGGVVSSGLRWPRTGIKGGIGPRVIKGKYADGAGADALAQPGRPWPGSGASTSSASGSTSASPGCAAPPPRARPPATGVRRSRPRRGARPLNLAHEETVAHAISPGQRDKAQGARRAGQPRSTRRPPPR